MATGTMLNKPRILLEAKPALPRGLRTIAEAATGFFFVRCESHYYKISLGDIRYIESRKNYSQIVTTERKYMVLAPLKDFEDALPSPAFCRVHRAFLVGLAHVSRFDRKLVFMGQEQLPIGSEYLHVLFAMAPVFNPVRGRAKV
jgi:DNA-binding LytR/AlgR family response regulator